MDNLFSFPATQVERSKRRLWLIGLSIVSVLTVFAVVNPVSVSAWSTSQTASVDCFQNVTAVFHNTEPSQSQYAMNVTVNSLTKTVNGGNSATWTFKKSGSSVTFYLVWADGHPGSDSRTVTITPESNCVTTTTTTTQPSTTTTSSTTTSTSTTSTSTTTTAPTTTTTTAPSTTTTSTTQPTTTTTQPTTTTTAVSTTTTTRPTTTSTVPTTSTTLGSTTTTVVSTTSTRPLVVAPTTPPTTEGKVQSFLPKTGQETGTVFFWACVLILGGLALMAIREMIRLIRK